MSIAFEDSYAGMLRASVGNRRLILPGARAIVRDGDGRVLLIRRRDDGRWGMPAGSLERGESVTDCCVREVREETGLTVAGAELIAIYSGPRYHFTNAYGGEHQMLSFVFLTTDRGGTLQSVTDETTDARFFAPDALPPDTYPVYRETLDDLVEYERTGRVVLK